MVGRADQPGRHLVTGQIGRRTEGGYRLGVTSNTKVEDLNDRVVTFIGGVTSVDVGVVVRGARTVDVILGG